jgi:hypothetical protein
VRALDGPSNILDLPDRAEQLSAAWLTAAFRAGPTDIGDAAVIRCTPTTIVAGDGLSGEITRLELDWDMADAALPRSIVAKQPTRDEEQRELVSTFGFYETEHRFYRDLADRVGVRVPRCYFTGADPDSCRSVQLLEDLTALAPIDHPQGIDESRLALVVELAADLHARWWNADELASIEWLGNGRVDHLVRFKPVLERSVDAFLARSGPELDRRARRTTVRFAERYDSMVDARRDMAMTLIHRDLRAANVLLGGEPVLLDWAIVGAGSAGYDIAHLLGTSVEPDVQADALGGVLVRYRRQLAAGGVELDADEIARLVQVGALWCLVNQVVVGAVQLEGYPELVDERLRRERRRVFELAKLLDVDELLG